MVVTAEVKQAALDKLRLAFQQAHQAAATDQAGVEAQYAIDKAPLLQEYRVNSNEAGVVRFRTRMKPLALARDGQYQRIGAIHRAAREAAKVVYRTETGEEPPEV